MIIVMRKRVFVVSILIAVLAVIGFAFLAQPRRASSKPKLIMGTAPGFKPFEYTNHGKIVGIDVDLAQEIAKDQNKQLVIEEFNFDGLITALQAGKIDMIAAGMTVTPDRAKSVDFSDSYYSASQMIMVRRDEKRIRSKADLNGRTVGVELGTTGDELLKNLPNINAVQFPILPAALQELRGGKIDAIVLDNAPAIIYAKVNSDVKVLPNKLSQEQYAIAIAKGRPELLAQINRTIARVKADGSLDKSIKTNFEVELSKKMSFKEIFLGGERYKYILNGLMVTLGLTVMSVFLGVILGFFTALMIISNWQPLKFLLKSKDPALRTWYDFNPLKFLAKIYTTIIRGTPLLVQLLIMYYIVFGDYQGVPKIVVAAVAFGINSGAYVAEIIRAGFENLPKGQWEAAKALGLTYPQTIIFVTMPQAMKASLPSLINEFITMLKETAIVGWIGLGDLMRGADNIRFETATAFEALLVAAIIYLSLTTVLTKIMSSLERKLNAADRN